MNRLDRLLKKSVRLILNSDLYLSRNTSTVIHNLSLVYKGLNSLAPSYISSMLRVVQGYFRVA